jgi:hypothetical protein
MSGRDKLAGEINDPIVEGALKHFKASIDAWSEAAYSQPRTVVRTAKHIWRLAAAWALGCLLAAASLAGAMHERHARQESARIAAIKAAEQKAALEPKAPEQSVQPVAATIAGKRQPTAVKRAASENEDLLATVDSDVSRQVPAAMEPLAQMMENDGSN